MGQIGRRERPSIVAIKRINALGIVESKIHEQIAALKERYPTHEFKLAVFKDYVSITIRSTVQSMDARCIFLYSTGVAFSIGFREDAKNALRQLFEQCYDDKG